MTLITGMGLATVEIFGLEGRTRGAVSSSSGGAEVPVIAFGVSFAGAVSADAAWRKSATVALRGVAEVAGSSVARAS